MDPVQGLNLNHWYMSGLESEMLVTIYICYLTHISKILVRC